LRAGRPVAPRPIFTSMRVTLTRSGGFAGIQRPPVVLDTAALPPARAAEGRAVFEKVPFPTLPAAIKGKPQPDRFSYGLEVEAEDGRRHRVSFGEADASRELMAFVRWVEAAAKK